MRSDKYNKQPQKPKEKNGLNNFTRFWAIVCFLAAAAFAGTAIYVDVLPLKYLCLALAGLAIISFLIIRPLYSRKSKKAGKIIAMIFSLVLLAGCGVGIAYMTGTLNFFDKVTDTKKVQTEDYYLIVKKDSKYKELEDIKDKTVYTYLTKEVNYSDAKGQLKKKENVEYKMQNSLSDLADGLVSGKYEIIFVSSGHYNTICEEHASFKTDTKILYTVKVKMKSKDISKAVDVTKQSYNIYVSGLDVEGNIDAISRSDVNMIVTVNPKTHKILLTSIPRDYQIKLPTKGDKKDKLTHTGVYGIGETVGAVEKLTGLDINYYVKVNYTTVTRLVDSIGGIDVDSDFAFSTHGMKARFSFVKGMNHLDGVKALAFARERKSFEAGDIQRNKNQQKVIEAIIKKATSSGTILSSYNTILSSIEDNVEINMKTEDIKKIVKQQLEDMPTWTVTKQNLEGIGENAQCYSTGDYFVYVMKPDESSVVAAVDQIIAVMEGTDTKTVEKTSN